MPRRGRGGLAGPSFGIARGIGKTLAERHITGARSIMASYFIELEDRDLAYVIEGTPEFEAYVADMLWAQRYAAANRDKMMTAALASLVEVTSDATTEVERINCHHNFAAREHHRGRDGWVIRKGAIRARRDDRGVIPGSMGTASFIVTGLGNVASFESCSHGAGRRMSRGRGTARADGRLPRGGDGGKDLAVDGGDGPRRRAPAGVQGRRGRDGSAGRSRSHRPSADPGPQLQGREVTLEMAITTTRSGTPR